MKIDTDQYQLVYGATAFSNAMKNELIIKGHYDDHLFLEKLFRELAPNAYKNPDQDELRFARDANQRVVDEENKHIRVAFGLSHLAYFQWRLGNVDRALDTLESAIQVNSDLLNESGGFLYPEAHRAQLFIHRFEIYAKLDRVEDGREDLLKALASIDSRLVTFGECTTHYFSLLDVVGMMALGYFTRVFPERILPDLGALDVQSNSATAAFIRRLIDPYVDYQSARNKLLKDSDIRLLSKRFGIPPQYLGVALAAPEILN